MEHWHRSFALWPLLAAWVVCAGTSSVTRDVLDEADRDLAALSDAYTLWREAQRPETWEEIDRLDGIEKDWLDAWARIELACDALEKGRIDYERWREAYRDAKALLIRIGALP